MTTIATPTLSPGFGQPGKSMQRLASSFFISSDRFPELAVLPLVINGTTLNTSPVNIAGFGALGALLEGGPGTIQLKLNHLDPRDQTTILFSRNAGVPVGAGLIYILFGVPVLDVNYIVSLGFTGSGAGARINQFPGLWGCVR
jgi:hypothetical protein